jgi:uncharacterized membrane protein
MERRKLKFRDRDLEFLMGVLLIIGVIISGTIVFIGTIIYLIENPDLKNNYNIFIGEPQRLRNLIEIMRGAFHFQGRPLIQFGLVLLIATPVARVVFAVFGFFVEKDRMYTMISLFVLITLLLSLIGGLGK